MKNAQLITLAVIGGFALATDGMESDMLIAIVCALLAAYFSTLLIQKVIANHAT